MEVEVEKADKEAAMKTEKSDRVVVMVMMVGTAWK